MFPAQLSFLITRHIFRYSLPIRQAAFAMNRNLNFLFLLVISGLLFSCEEKEEAPKRPNIVFIMSYDHAYQAISAYDNCLIETPNIDMIAKFGILLSHASVTNSFYSPSQSSILTGKHSHVNGKIDNHNPFDTTNITFPQILQQAGYQTAMF